MKVKKKELNLEFIKKWMKSGINPLVLSILDRRGIDNEQKMINFFAPVIEDITSPFLIKNITEAYNRIIQAINNKQKIIIFGDIDVDGTTSTVILYNFLKKMKADVSWEIPLGNDPYGLCLDTIQKWPGKYNLCITVDCGISNTDEINYLKESGIDTIIIDHHQPLKILPEAFSIINPKVEESFIFDDIAACGVVFIFLLGFIYYKSEFYNKTMCVFYEHYGEIKTDIYMNLIKIDSILLNSIKDIEIDMYFIYTESLKNNENIKSLNRKLILLNDISKIYNNSFLKLINNNCLNSRISLNNFLFNSINKINQFIYNNISLVMLGTMADVMPIKNINRIITKYGMNLLKQQHTGNITRLMENMDISPEYLNTKDITWYICPLLNAPGRMGDARKTISFFNNKQDDINDVIQELLDINEERKKTGDEVYELFLTKVNENIKNYNNNLIFFSSENLNKGLTGIVASKIFRETGHPVIIAAREGDYYSGSIRGDSNFHFVEFLEKSSGLLSQFGGHKNAAGFRIHKDKIEDFKSFLQEFSHLIASETDTDTIEIDAELPVQYLDYNLINILSIFEPFGVDNRNPVFFTPGLKVHKYYKIGKNKEHLKIVFHTGNMPFVGIYWNKANWFDNIPKDKRKFDVCYQLELNKYNGQISLQMIILGLRSFDISGEN